jgi:hypothetical protein
MNEEQPLHPMSLAEILDRTAQIYRSRFLVFFGIGLIPAGTVFVFAAAFFAFFAWFGSNKGQSARAADIIAWLFLGLMLLLVGPVCLAVTALGSAAMTDAAGRIFLGERITIREAYRGAWKRGWRYIWLYLLVVLVVAVVPMLGFLLSALGSDLLISLGSRIGLGDVHIFINAAAVLLFGVLVAFGLWMLLRFCLSFPVSVVEQTSAWKALKRAGSISLGTRGRIILLYLMGAILGYVLALGLSIPAIIGLALIPALGGAQHSQTLGEIFLFVTWGAYFAVKAFTKPVYGIALTLFYFDQRIRKEGFDIEWMMLHAGMAIDVPPAPEAAVPETTTANETAIVIEPIADTSPIAQLEPPVIDAQRVESL